MNMQRFMMVAAATLGVILAGSRHVQADDGRADGAAQAAGAEQQPLEVKLFEAIKEKQLEVGVIAHSFSQISLFARNLTAQPLRVELPEVIGAIPVQRQLARQMRAANQMRPGRPGGRTRSLASGYDQGGSQGLGGAFFGGQWGGGSLYQRKGKGGSDDEARPAGPAWTIPPGKIYRQQVATFCLEFGKPDPSRHIPYRLCELKEVNNNPIVRDLLVRFGKGDVDQRIAQIAAWHVANKVPWQALAQIRLEGAYARRGRRFAPQELMLAKGLIESLPSYQKLYGFGGGPGLNRR